MKVKRDPLDDLFSEFIRKRAMKLVGGCERCLALKFDTVKDNGDIFPAWMTLQCSHFFGRGQKSVRYDEDNAAGLCFGCHQYLGSHPLEHTEWFRNRLGESFVLLLARSRVPARFIDKEAIGLYLKEQIRRLEE